MRKYLTNGAILSSVFGAVGVLKASKEGPRDWRLALMWVSWGISVAIAVGSVIEDNKDQGALER